MSIEVKNGQLYYFGHNLVELANEFGTPLKITFLDVIKSRVQSLKKCFNKAIKNNDYKGSFIYLNANKANYGKEEIMTSLNYSDGLETSSYYDLLLTKKIFELTESKSKKIYSNGFKTAEYLDTILDLNENGFDIVDIIDSIDEFYYLANKNVKLKVGLRIHLSSLYSEEAEDDRFGLNKEELKEILNKIKNTKLVLTTVHFHQRGFDYEESKFFENLDTILNYYKKISKEFSTIKNLNIGGGTPLPIDYIFDYDLWTNKVIKHIKKFMVKNNLKHPNIISENGKYSQKDSTVNIYKIIGSKDTGEIWKIIDGSLLIAMPEMYALGEPILVKPINNLEQPFIKAKLAGVTCDCDDVYFDKEKGYFELPNANDNLIALLGTGSYQNSMNGKGGVHHCLLPEEKDVIVYKDKNKKLIKKVRKNLQSIEDIYKLLNI